VVDDGASFARPAFIRRAQGVTRGFKSLNASGSVAAPGGGRDAFRARKKNGPAMPARRLGAILRESARIGRAGVVRLLLHLLADLLHVLAGTLHGVAGDEEIGGKQGKQCQGNDALHGTLLWNGLDRGASLRPAP